jgi:hypothetical protein
MAAVVLGNAVGLAANIAASVHFQKSAEAMSAASASLAADSIALSNEYFDSSQAYNQHAGFIASVQAFSEVTVLLLIVVAFVVTGTFCIRRVRTRLLSVDHSSEIGASIIALRLQILGTAAFVFVAFLIRSVASTMLAVAFQSQDSANVCPGSGLCDASCYNAYTHLLQWNAYTPEFQLTVVLISSPLALIVALWGMTSKSLLRRMNPNRPQVQVSMKTRSIF